MALKTFLATFLPFLSLAGAADLPSKVGGLTEIVNGYTFVHDGPSLTLPKDTYELQASRTALKLLKTRLGDQGLAELLKPDIAEADAYWKDAVSRSNGWVPADARGVAFLPNITAIRFALWSTSTLADAINNEANPEHYGRTTVQLPSGQAQSQILEGWGGKTTQFTIPDYSTPPDRKALPFIRPMADFPVQAAGKKVLLDGTMFGALHLSVKDVKGEEYGQPMNGIEVWATVWIPNAVPEAQFEFEREHMIIEIINMSQQAQKDIESGAFAPPV